MLGNVDQKLVFTPIYKDCALFPVLAVNFYTTLNLLEVLYNRRTEKEDLVMYLKFGPMDRPML